MSYFLIGFNGERRDAVNSLTHLGNGYRAFNPGLRHFTCPDSLSPFYEGGINPYAYCTGDPVNRSDPSGHMSIGQWVGMAMSLVAGIAISILTDGAAIPVAASLMITVASEATLGAGTELVAEAVNGQRIHWGQVGIAAGLGAATAMAGRALGAVYRGAGREMRAAEEIITLADEKNLNIINASRVMRLRNGSRIRSANFMFDDTYHNSARLNIVLHGRLNPNSGIAEVRAVSPGRSFSGRALASHMRDEMEIDFSDYEYVRILMCYSSSGGTNSFAAQFAEEIGIRVKAFSGRVSIKNPMQDIADRMIFQNDRAIISESHANTELLALKNRPRNVIKVLKHGEDNTSYTPAYFNERGEPVEIF